MNPKNTIFHSDFTRNDDITLYNDSQNVRFSHYTEAWRFFYFQSNSFFFAGLRENGWLYRMIWDITIKFWPRTPGDELSRDIKNISLVTEEMGLRGSSA